MQAEPATVINPHTPWRRGYRDAAFFPAAAGLMFFPGSPYQPLSFNHQAYVLGAMDYAHDHDLKFKRTVS